MNNLNALMKKFLTREVLLYVVFGVLTTAVNFISFYLLTLISIDENIANVISIIIAVLFAFFTNRKFVFNSDASTFKDKLREFYKFILGRSVSMVIEAGGFYLLFSILGIQEMISKVIISIIIIILNFFISKFYAFKK